MMQQQKQQQRARKCDGAACPHLRAHQLMLSPPPLTHPHSQYAGSSRISLDMYDCGCRDKASLPLTWAASRDCVGGTSAAAAVRLPSACRVRKASGGDWAIGSVTRDICHIVGELAQRAKGG